MFQTTTSISKIIKLEAFVKGIQGGTSAGKTFGIIPIEVNHCCTFPNTETSIVSESFPHLKRGAIKDFKKIMKSTGRWFDSRWHKTDSIYTFGNGSTIEFFSADNDSKLRGARRDRLYINEANNITFLAYTELASRTKQSITLDWNPINEFWFHEELQGDADVDMLILSYLDNEACPESAKKFILKAKEKAKTSSWWANWYKVYGLGHLGRLEGVVLENWKQVDKVPKEAELIGYAIDFGFTNDPTTLIACYKWNGKLVWKELIYEKGLTNDQIAKRMKSLGIKKNDFVVADSSEPKSIAEINAYGFSVKGAEKGRDSINFGISVLQEHEMLVTSDSVNMIKELRKYSWDKDKTGKRLNKPIDEFNHTIDPMRYIAQMKLSKKKSGKRKWGGSRIA
ncbi:PBSX family phage terminase large subunit [Aquimarina hainanensis]|uniref:PBSX family phage terminase large subunit n=1 Tax=Aquimarina hainanensis TaxID=1578017 RepID=A0ABW5N9Y7_9FLAO